MEKYYFQKLTHLVCRNVGKYNYDYLILLLLVLVVTGDTDKIVKTKESEQIYTILKDNPNCKTKLVVLKDCGHSAIEEYPDKFLNSLLDYLKEINIL